MKAVIPAAGLGTRFLPAAKSQPKEMLPIVDTPAIQYVVEEAVASGIRDILVITGRGKRALEDHFDRSLELEDTLRRKGDERLLQEVQRVADMADLHYIRQKEARGLGHAVLCARSHVGQEPFAVLLGDDVVFSREPCTLQLRRVFEKVGGCVVAVERIPKARAPWYGVVKLGKRVAPGLHEAVDLVEKPSPEEAPSNLGILGRYLLTPGVFQALARTRPDRRGEVQLTDALRELLGSEKVYAYEFEGKRYDLGNKVEWLKTNLEVALLRRDTRDEVLRFVRQLARKPPPPVLDGP